MKKIQEFWIDFKRGAGKQLLVFGALFLMNPWSFWYGLPVYLVGLILIWNSSISKKNEVALDLYAISYRRIYLFDYRIDLPVLLKNVLQHRL